MSTYVDVFNQINLVDDPEKLDTFKAKDDGCRLIVGILAKAVQDVVAPGNKINRMRALHWLVFENDQSENIIRDLGLQLIRTDKNYLIEKIIKEIGRDEYTDIALGCLKLSKKDRIWA